MLLPVVGDIDVVYVPATEEEPFANPAPPPGVPQRSMDVEST